MINDKLISKEKPSALLKNFAVSVIIVNWNSGNYLKTTLDSLYKQTNDIEFEVIVLDNNSNKNDLSYKLLSDYQTKFNNFKVIYNKENFGFAKANNIGIKQSLGRYVLLLNPDVIVESNVVKILSDYMDENPQAGMSGPKVLNPDRTFQTSCLRGEPYPLSVLYHLSGLAGMFKNNPKFNQFTLTHLDKDKIQKAAGLSGCCMIVRKELIEKIGLMDERFFLYQEETDWCWRAYQEGAELIYNPEAIIVHDRGSITKQRLLKTNYVFCASMMKFFKKHHFGRYNFAQKAFFTMLIWGNFAVRYVRVKLFK